MNNFYEFLTKLLKLVFRWGPSAAAGGVTLDALLKQDWRAAVINALLTTIAGAWGAFSPKFVAALNEDLEKEGTRYGKRVVPGVRWLGGKAIAQVKWGLSNFDGRYRAAMVDRFLEHEGDGYHPFGVRPNLAKVFVPLRVDLAQMPSEVSANLVPADLPCDGEQIWDFLRGEANDRRSRQIAILAAAGFGKTTLLRHVALLTAQGKQPKGVPSFVPVLIAFRTVRSRFREEMGRREPLERFIEGEIKKIKAIQPLQPPPNWVKNQLKQGRLLVMLDGLDEVANTAERERVCKWLNDQLTRYKSCQSVFLITSRPDGYLHKTLTESITLVLQVQPFNWEQIRSFVYGWYCELRLGDRAYSAAAEGRLEEEAEAMLREIRQVSALRSMAQNPLLITMMLAVRQSKGTLPRQRVKVYEEICTSVLVDRLEAKKIDTLLTGDQNQAVLQVLALALMVNHKKIRFWTEEGATIIADELAKFDPDLAPERFFEDVRKLTGLLVGHLV